MVPQAYWALNEVARELEDPYCFEPNDIPLARLQYQFNERILATANAQVGLGIFTGKGMIVSHAHRALHAANVCHVACARAWQCFPVRSPLACHAVLPSVPACSCQAAAGRTPSTGCRWRRQCRRRHEAPWAPRTATSR